MSRSSAPSSGGSPSPSGTTRYRSPSQRPRSMVWQRALQNGNCGHTAVLSPSISRSQIGQRTLIIGRRCLGLGAFCRVLARLLLPTLRGRLGLAVRMACAVGARRGAVFLRLGRRLVRFATVVGLVEAGPLEEDRRPGTEQPAQLLLAALGALRQRRLGHRLEFLEVVRTGLTM